MKLELPTNNGTPPVGAAYQSTVIPAGAFTIRAGVAVPSQMSGKFAPLGAKIGGQVQLGAITDCCCEQPVTVLLAVKTTLIPLGILLMVKLPDTTPADDVSVVAFELTLAE